MGDIIKFPVKSKADPELTKLIEMADEVDAVILGHLAEHNMDAKEVASILAHRLGTLLRHIDDKDQLWAVCEKVLKKQAVID